MAMPLSWECPVYGVKMTYWGGEFDGDQKTIYHDVFEDHTEVILYRVIAEI